MPQPHDIFAISEAPSVADQEEVIVGSRSIMVLVAQAEKEPAKELE
jgi:hypothetical protein